MTEMIIAGEPFNMIVEGDANAPVIVLSHAVGADLHEFDHLVPKLKQHFRVVRYDSRGLGDSVVSQGPYSISQLGHDALAILDALRLEKVNWVGHSEGGMVGLWLMIQAPERIDRAILANTAAQIGGAEVWNERIRIVQEKGMEGLVPTILENWFTRHFRERHPQEVARFEDALNATMPQAYAAHCAAVRDADLRAGLQTIPHPVLVIVGRHDPVTPPGVGALVASTIPGGKLLTLEAAHLSPVEAAEAFNQAVIEFLTGGAEKTMETQETRIEGDEEEKMVPTEPSEPMEEEHHKPRPPRAPRAPRPKPEPVMADEAEPEAAPISPWEEERTARPARAAPRKRPRKAAAKKAAAKKTARKAAARKPARKAAAKRGAAKRGAAKRGAVKRSAARRPVKKAARKAARKTVAKKGARKTAAKRAVKKASRKSAGRRPAARRGARRR